MLIDEMLKLCSKLNCYFTFKFCQKQIKSMGNIAFAYCCYFCHLLVQSDMIKEILKAFFFVVFGVDQNKEYLIYFIFR